MANLRIVGNGGQIMNMTSDWFLELAPMQTRNRAEEAVYLDGAQNIGVNRYNSLTVKMKSGFFKYITGGKTVEDRYSEVLSFLRDYAPFKIYEIGLGRDNRFLDECFLGSGMGDVVRRVDLARSFEFDIIALNPFWLEPATQYSGTWANMAETILSNTGDYETYPVFEITATTSTPTLKLINLSDQNRRCEVNYPFFNTGDIMTIDSYNNRVIVNSIDVSEYCNGNFLRFLKGTNNIKYLGQTVNIKTDWYIRRTY